MSHQSNIFKINTAIFVMLIACLISGCMGNFKAEVREEKSWTLDAKNLTALNISNTNGNISIIGSATDQIHIKAQKIIRANTEQAASDYLKKVVIQVKPNDDVLRIYHEIPKLTMNYTININYDITCPSSFGGKMVTTNGNISINSLQDDLTTTTTNGTITLKNVSGELDVKTTNGNINVGAAQIGSQNSFTTTNGSISLKILEKMASLTSTTTNGSINLQLPTDFSGFIKANTINGRVESDFKQNGESSKKNKNLSLQVGENQEVKVNLKTTNGSIRITKP